MIRLQVANVEPTQNPHTLLVRWLCTWVSCHLLPADLCWLLRQMSQPSWSICTPVMLPGPRQAC